jgi:chromosome segregation ATPase
MAEIDDIKKQINDLNKRIGELGGDFKINIDAYISSFGNGIDAANKALKEMRKTFDGLDTDVNYFYTALKNITKELKGQSNYNNDIANSYSKLVSIANKLKYDQDGIQTLSKKELQNLQKKVEIQQTDLTSFLKVNQQAEQDSLNKQKSINAEIEYYKNLQKENRGLTKEQLDLKNKARENLKKEESLTKKIHDTNKEVISLLEDEEIGINKLIKTTQRRLDEEIKIQKTLGI